MSKRETTMSILLSNGNEGSGKLKKAPEAPKERRRPPTRQETHEAVGAIWDALHYFNTRGSEPKSGIWRIARCVGNLARGLDDEDFQELVLNSVNEGRQGMLIV